MRSGFNFEHGCEPARVPGRHDFRYQREGKQRHYLRRAGHGAACRCFIPPGKAVVLFCCAQRPRRVNKHKIRMRSPDAPSADKRKDARRMTSRFEMTCCAAVFSGGVRRIPLFQHAADVGLSGGWDSLSGPMLPAFAPDSETRPHLMNSAWVPDVFDRAEFSVSKLSFDGPDCVRPRREPGAGRLRWRCVRLDAKRRRKGRGRRVSRWVWRIAILSSTPSSRIERIPSGSNGIRASARISSACCCSREMAGVPPVIIIARVGNGQFEGAGFLDCYAAVKMWSR